MTSTQQIVIESRSPGFPPFVIDPANGNPEFVAVVEKKIRAIDLGDNRICEARFQEFYRLLADKGVDDAVCALILSSTFTAEMQVACGQLEHHLGCLILSAFSASEKSRFLPYNDVVVHPNGRYLSVSFSSLETVKLDSDRFYVSSRRPKVKIDNRYLTVAFTKHIIDQVCERIVPDYLDYMGLGNAHAFFADCVYFEPTQVLPQGKRGTSQFTQKAIGLFQNCRLNKWHPGILHREIELCRNVAFCDQQLWFDMLYRPCYFRVGYCPVVLKGEHAIATTFLNVGFCRTPEYLLLKESTLLSKELKKKYLALADRDKRFTAFDATEQNLCCWFHQNGVPQVVAMDHVVFEGEPVGGLLDSPYAKCEGMREKLLAVLPPQLAEILRARTVGGNRKLRS